MKCGKEGGKGIEWRDGRTEVGMDGEIEGQDRKRKGRRERVKEEGREGRKEGNGHMLSAGLAKIGARVQNALTNQPGMYWTREVSTENLNEKHPGNKLQP